MPVEYNEKRGVYQVRHEPLTDEFIVEGFNNIELNSKNLKKLEAQRIRVLKQLEKVKSEIEEARENMAVFSSVTDIREGVPISENISLPSEDNKNGRYSMTLSKSSRWSSGRKYVEAWTNAHLDKKDKLGREDIWAFSLKDGYNNQETFLARQYSGVESNDGFNLDFIQMIAYDFIVNGREIKDIYRKLDPYFKIYKRNRALCSLLEG